MPKQQETAKHFHKTYASLNNKYSNTKNMESGIEVDLFVFEEIKIITRKTRQCFSIPENPEGLELR